MLGLAVLEDLPDIAGGSNEAGASMPRGTRTHSRVAALVLGLRVFIRGSASDVQTNTGPNMRLASFKVNGRSSYGAVTDGGIIDLARKLTKYPSLLDVLRAQALGEARAAATGPADHRLADVEMLPPVPAPEKIICVGINYPERATEYKDRGAGRPKYPNLFLR